MSSIGRMYKKETTCTPVSSSMLVDFHHVMGFI